MYIMKKLLLSCITLFSLVSSVLLAANDTRPIQEVKLRYCNGTGAVTKTLFLPTQPNKKETICMEFTNEGPVGVKIGVNFVDGTLTADAEQKKACLPEGTKTQFGQYVTGYESELYLPPRWLVRTYATLEFPSGYAGASYGCTTFHFLWTKTETVEQNWQMFEIFSRVASFVDAFVDGEISPQLITIPVVWEVYKDIAHNPNFVIYRKDFWHYTMRTTVYNTGNIATSGDMSLSRSTWWGIFHSSYHMTGQVVLPQQSQTLEVSLPWYLVWFLWGPTTVSLAVEYHPIYLWAFADKDSSVFTLSDSNTTFFFPRIIIPLLCVLLYLQYRLHKKKKIIWLWDQHVSTTIISSPKKSRTTKKIASSTKTRSRRSES